MRSVFPILLILLFVSCKSKQKLLQPQENSTISASNETVNNLIKNHEAVKTDFKTAYLKASIDYTDTKQSLSLSSDIRIKKDEIILVSVKMLGIVMAKAMITPSKVEYYEKLNGKYFEGDYKTLSNWLGTDLDFQKVQNMMLGKALDSLSKGKYEIVNEDDAPKLLEISQENFSKSYVFDPVSFWLKKQEIIQNNPSRKLIVNYLNYKTFPEAILPGELLIFALQNEQTTNITIQYKNATFNEELTFPYSVPSGYEQIIIN
jgi:hypothetical protein